MYSDGAFFVLRYGGCTLWSGGLCILVHYIVSLCVVSLTIKSSQDMVFKLQVSVTGLKRELRVNRRRARRCNRGLNLHRATDFFMLGRRR